MTTKAIQDLTFKALYGEHNEHVIQSLAATYSAALELIQKGFKVSSVKAGIGAPVIKIELSEECSTLEAMTAVSTPAIGGGFNHRRVAIVRGAKVTWTEWRRR